MRVRLFAAIRPPRPALDHLENALRLLRGDDAPGRASGGLRWTPPQDRHVTVAFFGEVPEGYLDDVAHGLDEVAAAHAPFETALRGAGLFDGRTLWVGCSGDAWAPLMADACRLGSDLLGRAEDRRSRPHLTIARSAGGRRAGERRSREGATRPGGPGGSRAPRHAGAAPPADAATLAHALALYTGPQWSAGEVVLVSSRLGAGPGGSPLHEVVHRSSLGVVAG